MTLTKKRTTARLLAFVLAALMFFSVFAGALTQVFAAANTVKGTDGNSYDVVWNDANADGYYDTADGDSITSISTGGADVTSTALALVEPNMPKKPTAVEKTDDAINQIVDGMNVKADVTKATQSLNGLTEIVNTVIGVLAVFILTLIGILTAVDILYLEVPALHNSMDTKAMDKGQTNKSGGVKPKIVSEDASQAYSEAMENGKNPMLIYLKKRVVAYIAVAIVLYMLLSGNLALIVKVVLKALNGVFGWFEEYSATM